MEKKLLDGTIEGVKMRPETVKQDVVRLMKVLTVTRKPDNLIANVEMQVRDEKGEKKSLTLEIDEATAGALNQVFVDFRKSNPKPAPTG
jgi:hypothetical protein